MATINQFLHGFWNYGIVFLALITVVVFVHEMGHYLVARLNGVARYGALIGRDRSVTFAVENVRGEPACEGTFTNDTASTGRRPMRSASRPPIRAPMTRPIMLALSAQPACCWFRCSAGIMRGAATPMAWMS